MSACCSYPSIRDRLILLNGWSKTYAMTGWRLGYAVWPGKLYDYARKLAVNLHSCVNAPTQYAGLAALNGPQDEVAKMVAEFDRRRKVVVDGLNQLPGVSLRHAQGRVLRLSQHQAHRLESQGARVRAARRRRRRALSAGPISASSAKAMCGSPTPTRRRIFERRSTAWASFSCRAKRPDTRCSSPKSSG